MANPQQLLKPLLVIRQRMPRLSKQKVSTAGLSLSQVLHSQVQPSSRNSLPTTVQREGNEGAGGGSEVKNNKKMVKGGRSKGQFSLGVGGRVGRKRQCRPLIQNGWRST